MLGRTPSEASRQLITDLERYLIKTKYLTMGYNEILLAIQKLPKAEQVELIKQAIDIINVDESISPELLASLRASKSAFEQDPGTGVSAHEFLRDRMKKALSHGV